MKKGHLDHCCLLAGGVSGISSRRRPLFTLKAPSHVVEMLAFRVVLAWRSRLVGMRPGRRADAYAPPDSPKASSTASPAQDVASPDPASSADDAAKVKANLAKLDATDRKLAEKQKVCPVSGELLGSMGKPHKVTLQGRTVFLCCPGCEEELRANADEYLKKVK